jgi:hypothetical protein
LSLIELRQQFEGFAEGCPGYGSKTAEELDAFLASNGIVLRRRPDQSASFRLGNLLSKMVALESDLDATRKEIGELLRKHPDLDWTKAE